MPPSIQTLQLASTHGEPLRRLRVGPVDIFRGPSGGKYPDGNYLVVRGSDSQVSFDMPLASRAVPPALMGRDLVILSHVHEDHTAGLDLLPNTPLHVHRGDMEAARSIEGLALHYGYSERVNTELCARAVHRFHFVPRPDAIAYDDGATWDLGGVRVRAIHAPGHTSGHCILMVEPQGIAFIADIDLSGFGPYYGDATSSLADFRLTLSRLPELPADCWITSHHKGIVCERESFLEHLQKFGDVLDRRDQALLDSLRERSQTLEQLAATRFVYPAKFVDVYVDDVERRSIAQHLHALALQGRAFQEEGIWRAS